MSDPNSSSTPVEWKTSTDIETELREEERLKSLELMKGYADQQTLFNQ